MASYHRKSHGGIVFSLALHVALVAALMVSVDMPWRRQAPATAPIQAEIIDAKAFEAELKAKDDAKRAAEEAAASERERIAAEQRQRELEAQRERDRVAREQADRQRAEQERIAEQKRIEEQQEKERLAKEAERLEQERLAQQAEKDRIERERKEREERERREREERERLAREKAAEEARLVAELAEEQRRAEEAARAAAARQTAKDAYVRSITNHIEKRWSRPPNAQPGLKCVVNVRQIPSGDIINFNVASCNGDEIVRRSVEAALTLSSPLPTPSDPSLFERDLEVIFEPVFQ